MINLPLDADEGIVLQATDVERYGEKDDVLSEMVLTNKSIICIYRFKSGIFAKAETKVEKVPLNKIKVINGNVQVRQIDHDEYGVVLQILYSNGKREYFSFWDTKQDTPKWLNSINAVIKGDDVLIEEVSKEIVNTEHKASVAEKIEAEEGNCGLMNVMDSKERNIDEETESILDLTNSQRTSEMQQNPDSQQDSIKCQVENEQSTQMHQGTFFCTNCGERLNDGAKFCHGCGVKIGQVNISLSPDSTNEKRRQEYVGKIYKCPNCGSVITQTTAICPDCGMRLSGTAVLSSVKDFNQQLMAIEASRKKSKLLDIYTQSANPADTQKLSLIRSYPIPNTVDDVREFIFLAIANIDMKLSKNSAVSKMTSMLNSSNVNLSMKKEISDAWVAKLQQVYLKAEATFPNDPAFKQIRQAYYDKMAALKIKV